MKRLLMTLVLIVGTGVALQLMNRASAVAGGGFSERDLNGEYVFSFTEIRMEYDPASMMPVTDYCDHTGTIVADGAGTMQYEETVRCSFSGPGTGTGTIPYTVDPSGSVLLFTNPDDPTGNPTHGQIVERGRGFLLDGTTLTNPYTLIQHGMAMKR